MPEIIIWDHVDVPLAIQEDEGDDEDDAAHPKSTVQVQI